MLLSRLLRLGTAALLLTLAAATGALAQGPGSGGPQPDPAPTSVPLDGGASLLLAGGVAYGLSRLRRRTAA